MEKLQERLSLTKKALLSFGKLVHIQKPTDVERDAAIQRFEYSFEATWKTAKQYLYTVEGIDAGSPKGVIRYGREVGLFDEKETITALQMVNDRNLTVHTYNEEVAEQIHANLSLYFHTLNVWVGRIEQRLN